MPDSIPELRTCLSLAVLFVLPGWALLSLTGEWRYWRGLQLWIVAIAASIALLPVLFYLMAAIDFSVGPRALLLFLLASLAAIVASRLVTRSSPRPALRLEPSEWLAVLVFAGTLFTRFWVAVSHPFPAWSDSLHHVLITQLTAVSGRLPANMMPYFPIPLSQYHLGLYALAAPVQWLAGLPAHTALLWTAQALNGLCGLGVYLILDRKLGRPAAIVGAVIAGLACHQPAFYVNWGRFTQVAAQTVLLPAWLLCWELIAAWREPVAEPARRTFARALLAAFLVAGVCLLHFRVAVFFGLLMLVTLAYEAWSAFRDRRHRHFLGRLAWLASLTVVFCGLLLWKTIRTHVGLHWLAIVLRDGLPGEVLVDEARRRYYEFPASSFRYLVAAPWLMATAAVCASWALWRRNAVASLQIAWVALLLLLGHTYLIGMPELNVTNLGAVLIMLYLPIALVVGAAAFELEAAIEPARRRMFVTALLAGMLALGVVTGRERAVELEEHRFFVTPADLKAMDWIRERTPPNAIFAVNSYFWLPHFPHGTDAGYWIPYLAKRRTTVGPMVSPLAPRFLRWTVVTSRLVKQLETDDCALFDLSRMQIRYVYLGAVRNPDDAGLNAALLAESALARLAYEDEPIRVFEILPPQDVSPAERQRCGREP